MSNGLSARLYYPLRTRTHAQPRTRACLLASLLAFASRYVSRFLNILPSLRLFCWTHVDVGLYEFQELARALAAVGNFEEESVEARGIVITGDGVLSMSVKTKLSF